MQARRLEFSPGYASNGSPPPPVQETHGAVVHAQSLLVGPPTQRMNNPGYAIEPSLPPPGFGTPRGVLPPTTPLSHS
eukprot:5345993-Prorocentrum_lima.AAC.1